MASGQVHDRITLVVSAPIGIATAVLWGADAGLISAAACLIGGFWLSPDLDTHSNALRRWGPLRGLWWPYRHLIPHRSLWSHGPLIGTALRLLWLLSWWVVLSLLIGWPTNAGLPPLVSWLKQQPQQAIALAIGLEASAWLHLILDGDPWPVEWSSRRLGHRRRR
mgnify:FL=1